MKNILSFKDFVICESFEIKNKPSRMTPTGYKKLFMTYLKPKYADKAESVLEAILDNYVNLIFFSTTVNNVQYIVLYGKEKGESNYTVHFNDINNIDNFKNTGVLKYSSHELFTYLFNIIYYYGLLKGHDIELYSEKENIRNKFYKKIAENIFKKYNCNYEVIEKHSSVVLKNKTETKTFLERMGIEHILEQK